MSRLGVIDGRELLLGYDPELDQDPEAELGATLLRRALETLQGKHQRLRRRWRRWQAGALLICAVLAMAAASGWMMYAAERMR